MVFVLPGFVIVGWWSRIPYWETMLVCATGGILGVMLSVPMPGAGGEIDFDQDDDHDPTGWGTP